MKYHSEVVSILMKNTEEETLKGTTTVGIVCKEGIVLAADRRATAGFVVNKKAKKIIQITDSMAVTMAGLVSDAQLLSKLVKAELKLKDLQSNRTSNIREAANLLGGMLYANLRKMSMVPGIVGFLLGGKDNEGFHLYDLGIDGSVTEVDDYVSDGSGSVFAFGVLETLFKKSMSVDEGVKLAARAINAALQRDVNTGNGIDVLTITDKGVQMVMEKELTVKLDI
ncbi:proteasome subunit beta [Candidatus Woesearchaeota archaeon]|nr:proteasome subunit beta [Candidatus Woesearchaeota archaeon]